MRKHIFGIIFGTVLIFAALACHASAAVTVNEAFESYGSAAEVFGNGKFITAATQGADKLSLEEEALGSYTNKYLSVSGGAGQLVTAAKLQSGKNAVSMRIRFSDGSNQLIGLRGSGSSDNTLVLTKVNGAVRLLHDSAKAMTLNAQSWYNFSMIVDTQSKTVTALLVREGTGESLSHTKTYTDSNGIKNLSEGAFLRFITQGTDKLCADDITVSDDTDRMYYEKEDFEQFSPGTIMTANNKVFAPRIGMVSVAAANTCIERANDNSYLSITGGNSNPLLYNMNLFSGIQVWEFDMKVADSTHTARVWLHKSGGASVDLIHFKKQSGTPVAKVLDKWVEDEWVDKLKNDFVHFKVVLNKGGNTISAAVYADGRLAAQKSGISADYNNIRLDVNAGYVPAEGEAYSQSSLSIDNLSCYLPLVPERTETVYVSPSGSDDNDGSEAAPLKTLAAAYSKQDTARIVVMSDMAYSTDAQEYSGTIIIEGAADSVRLQLPTNTQLYGNLTFDNITLWSGGAYPGFYANCKELVISDSVSSETRFGVYGGGFQQNLTGDTHITLRGGTYSRIYGGGYQGQVDGSAYITVGGNVNTGDSVDDDSDNFYASYVFGSGREAAVSGQTHIRIKDNAKIAYVFGAGEDSAGTVSGTDIRIEGGKVMNVFGGALEAPLECDTHITVTGGLAEGIFGGSHKSSLTGNTYTELRGGEVSRRVYSGCYSSGCSVTGNTYLVIAADADVMTGKELSPGNALDMTVSGGSRAAVNKNEINTVICTDNCGALYDFSGKNWDYIVKASAGGTVMPAGDHGKIYIDPVNGKHALIGSEIYKNGEIQIQTGETQVNFEPDCCIRSISAEGGADGFAVAVDAAALTDSAAEITAAVYDSSTRLVGVGRIPAVSSGVLPINISCRADGSEKYYVKAMMWDNMTPIAEFKTEQVRLKEQN